LIVDNIVLKYYFAVHQIPELCFTFRNLHPDNE
jgi:hypothetical protein